MSLSNGDFPSTLALPPKGMERRLAAKARAAAKKNKEDQGRNAGTAGGRRGGQRTETRKKFDEGGSFRIFRAPAATELDEELVSGRLSLRVGALLGFVRKCKCRAACATGNPEV